MRTQPVKDTSGTEPTSDVLPPSPYLDKVTMHLQQKIRACARKGVQEHTKTFDKKPLDNFLHGITPQEGSWVLKSNNGESYWEKGYIWRGLWSFKETPNFTNRQLTVKYFLVAKAPIKGFGNDVKLSSRELEINTGITAGQNMVPAAGTDDLELPPDYFDHDGTNEDEEGGEERDEKA